MDSDKQMSFLFEEGGIADDGMNRDPVSGNEVPSGSLAEEVRDDIPAQLSEGEYVVPADVVRYYGVKFFEDLRSDAKMGLNKMEQDGRIGGEPAMSNDFEDDGMGLTPEEEAELQAIMGEAPGFAEGGTVVSPDFSQFLPGFSFMGAGATQEVPSIDPQRSVTLYGPNGEVVNLILPVDQERYNSLMTEGYSETPIPQPAIQSAPQQQQDSDNEPFDIQRAQRDLNYGETGSYDFSDEDIVDLMEDPLSWGREQLQPRDKFGQAALGVIGAVAPGIGLFGQGAMIANDVNNIAKARAALNVAKEMGLSQDAIAEYETFLEEHIANSRGPVRSLVAGETFGTGRRHTDTLMAELAERRAAIMANPAAAAMNRATRSYIRDLFDDPNAQYSPGLAALADDMRSGRTGASYGNIPTGKISGAGGTTEGVVAYMDETGRPQALKYNGKTVFRDELGNLYVPDGFFGGYNSRNRTYLDEVVDENGNVHRSGVSAEDIDFPGMDLPDATGGIVTPDVTASSRSEPQQPSLPSASLPSASTASARRGPSTALERANAARAATEAAQARARAAEEQRQAAAAAREAEIQRQAAASRRAASSGGGGGGDDGPSYSLDTSSYSPSNDYSSQPSYSAPSSNTGAGGSGPISAADVSWVNKGGFITRRKKKKSK